MKFFGWLVKSLGVVCGSLLLENAGNKMLGKSTLNQNGNRTRCRYCGSFDFGDCSKSPNGKHEHILTVN